MTELEICNWALLKLGLRLIESLDEEDIRANYCKLLIYPLHQCLLRVFRWSFATKSIDLSPALTNTGELIYYLPKRCLRVLRMREGAHIRGNYIVVHDKTPSLLSIKFIEDVPLSVCDPLYCEALACKLASELCSNLVFDSQLRGFLLGSYDKALAVAVDMEGIESIERDEEY
ncbi:adaptor protein [Liberibacter phage P-PA19-1]|nr:adaptor protein [Liberibacter phage P-PA19-1]